MDDELRRYRIDEAHAALERIRRMGEDCAGLQALVDDARDRATLLKGIDYSAVKVATSPTDDQMVDAITALNDRIAGYVTALRDYEDERYHASRAMDRMEDFTEAKALRLRYLLGLRWESVCDRMNYSWDGMMALRRRALLHYYDVMPRELPAAQ